MFVYARSQVRTPFLYIGNCWTDCSETWCVARGPLGMRFIQDGDMCKGARVTVRTFKHICTFLLVHRPKVVLLVTIYFCLNSCKCELSL